MGCGCSGSKTTSSQQFSYKFTSPTGDVKTYASQAEARTAMSIAGGGVIEPVKR